MKKIKLLLLIILTFITFSYSQTLDSLSNKDFIIIKAVGDTMLGSYTPKRILPPKDGNEFVESVGNLLKDADIVMCNLEGSFVKEDFKPVKKGSGKVFNFGMPYYLAQTLKNLGFNVVSFNNNHVLDYGYEGYEFTKTLLKSMDINYATREDFAVIEVKGKKVAVVAFGFNGGKYRITDIENAKKEVSQLKSKYDIVIVSFHGGAEGKSALHVRNQTEYFLGENRGNVVEFARGVVDAGADLVIGHGPHVLRAVEIYKGKLIAYSLGNFLTYGNFNLKGYNGIGGILEVVLTKDGKFIKANFIPTKQISFGIPVYDESKQAIQLLNQLGKEDFPNSYYYFKSED
ncbi:MAG: CapA family protein [Sulfurihydrogenibium sp.]|uniref:CapA family protein n=1 Tax=Sulfurihydrogenibium sp. TaxID=2053621 RepID=UPI003D0F5428